MTQDAKEADEIHELLHSMSKQLNDVIDELRATRRSMDGQFAEIRHQLSTFGGYQTTRDQDIADLRARVERIERRLDLVSGDRR